MCFRFGFCSGHVTSNYGYDYKILNWSAMQLACLNNRYFELGKGRNRFWCHTRLYRNFYFISRNTGKNETEIGSDECAVKSNAYRRISLFASLLITSVLSFFLQRIMRHCKRLFKLISISLMTILTLLVFSWAIHDFLDGTPAWAQVLILVLAGVI